MFNAKKEIEMLRAQKKNIRKKRRYSSRLDVYTDELRQLKNHSATYSDIRRWLQSKNIDVEWSTVQSWFSKNG